MDDPKGDLFQSVSTGPTSSSVITPSVNLNGSSLSSSIDKAQVQAELKDHPNQKARLHPNQNKDTKLFRDGQEANAAMKEKAATQVSKNPVVLDDDDELLKLMQRQRQAERNTELKENKKELDIFVQRSNENTVQVQSAPKTEISVEQKQSKNQEASTSATQIYEAINDHSIFKGNNAGEVVGIIKDKSPEQIADIREAYKDHYGRNLDTDVLKELKENRPYRESLGTIITSDARAFKTEDLVVSLQKDNYLRAEQIEKILVTLPPELAKDMQAVLQNYNLTELSAIIPTESAISKTPELGALIREEIVLTRATQIKDILAAGDPVVAAEKIESILGSLNPAELKALQDTFFEANGTALRTQLEINLDSRDFNELNHLLLGERDMYLAQNLYNSIESHEDIIIELEEKFVDKDSAQRNSILSSYEQIRGNELIKDIENAYGKESLQTYLSTKIIFESQLSELDMRALELYKNGLIRSELSEQTITQILKNQEKLEYQDPVKIREVTALNIYEQLAPVIKSTDDKLDLKFSLFGKAKTLEEEALFAEIRHNQTIYNTPVITRKVIDLVSDREEQLNKSLSKIERQEKKVKDKNDEFKFYSLLDFLEKDITRYRMAKNLLHKMFENFFSFILGAVGFFIASRSGGSLYNNIAIAAVFATVGKVSLKSYFLSIGFSEEEIDHKLDEVRKTKRNSPRSRRRVKANRRAAPVRQKKVLRYSMTKRNKRRFRQTYGGRW